jgi:hypothetical protein
MTTATVTTPRPAATETPATSCCLGCGANQPGPHDFRCAVRNAEPIGPGDFIRSALGGFWCGIVLRPAAVVSGRNRTIPGFLVSLGNGGQDWISAEDAVLIAKADDYTN